MYRVYTFFKKEADEKPEYKNILKKTIDVGGLPKTSVWRIVREMTKIGHVPSAKKGVLDKPKTNDENFTQKSFDGQYIILMLLMVVGQQ